MNTTGQLGMQWVLTCIIFHHIILRTAIPSQCTQVNLNSQRLWLWPPVEAHLTQFHLFTDGTVELSHLGGHHRWRGGKPSTPLL